MPGTSAATRLPVQLLYETEDAPDRTLVRDAFAGDESAFRLLYRRHTPRVLSLVRRLTGGDGDACDDLLQDVWLRAMLGAPKFQWNSPFQTWLCGIAVRVYAESVRHRMRRHETDLHNDVAAPELDIGQDIDLDRAMAELPEHYRVVFVLHDVEGRTHHDIADHLGIATGTSKAYLHHARRKLRALLRTSGQEGSE